MDPMLAKLSHAGGRARVDRTLGWLFSETEAGRADIAA